MTDCEVLIVGGGPAGLSVASALDPGLRVIVAHQDAQIGQPVRTSGGTWVRDMERLEIPAHLWQRIDRLDFLADNAEAIFDDLADPMAVMDITGTYRHLASLSDGHDRQLWCGCSVVDVRRDGAGFVARLRHRDRQEEEVRAGMLVDASGWKMAALEPLGLASKPARTGVGIEYEFDRADFPANRAILFVGAAALTGYGWVFPTPDGRVRLGIGVIHPDTGLSPRDVMRSFETSGMADRIGLEIPKARVTNAGVIPSEPYAPQLVFGNLVRVGDSANMATPTVGEGIRIAIDAGRMMGAEITAHLAGDTRALHRYQTQCRRLFSTNYRFGLMMNRRIAGYSPDRWDKSVRRLSRLSEREMVALVRSEFDATTIARTIWLALKGKVLGRV